MFRNKLQRTAFHCIAAASFAWKSFPASNINVFTCRCLAVFLLPNFFTCGYAKMFRYAFWLEPTLPLAHSHPTTSASRIWWNDLPSSAEESRRLCWVLAGRIVMHFFETETRKDSEFGCKDSVASKIVVSFSGNSMFWTALAILFRAVSDRKQTVKAERFKVL